MKRKTTYLAKLSHFLIVFSLLFQTQGPVFAQAQGEGAEAFMNMGSAQEGCSQEDQSAPDGSDSLGESEEEDASGGRTYSPVPSFNGPLRDFEDYTNSGSVSKNGNLQFCPVFQDSRPQSFSRELGPIFSHLFEHHEEMITEQCANQYDRPFESWAARDDGNTVKPTGEFCHCLGKPGSEDLSRVEERLSNFMPAKRGAIATNRAREALEELDSITEDLAELRSNSDGEVLKELESDESFDCHPSNIDNLKKRVVSDERTGDSCSASDIDNLYGNALEMFRSSCESDCPSPGGSKPAVCEMEAFDLINDKIANIDEETLEGGPSRAQMFQKGLLDIHEGQFQSSWESYLSNSEIDKEADRESIRNHMNSGFSLFLAVSSSNDGPEKILSSNDHLKESLTRFLRLAEFDPQFKALFGEDNLQEINEYDLEEGDLDGDFVDAFDRIKGSFSDSIADERLEDESGNLISLESYIEENAPDIRDHLENIGDSENASRSGVFSHFDGVARVIRNQVSPRAMVRDLKNRCNKVVESVASGCMWDKGPDESEDDASVIDYSEELLSLIETQLDSAEGDPEENLTTEENLSVLYHIQCSQREGSPPPTYALNHDGEIVRVDENTEIRSMGRIAGNIASSGRQGSISSTSDSEPRATLSLSDFDSTSGSNSASLENFVNDPSASYASRGGSASSVEREFASNEEVANASSPYDAYDSPRAGAESVPSPSRYRPSYGNLDPDQTENDTNQAPVPREEQIGPQNQSETTFGRNQQKIRQMTEELARLKEEAEKADEETEEETIAEYDSEMQSIREELEKLREENERLKESEIAGADDRGSNSRSTSSRGDRGGLNPSSGFRNQSGNSAGNTNQGSTPSRVSGPGPSSAPSNSSASAPTENSQAQSQGQADSSAQASTSGSIGGNTGSSGNSNLSLVSQVPQGALNLDRLSQEQTQQSFQNVREAVDYAKSQQRDQFVFQGILYEVEGDDAVAVARVETSEEAQQLAEIDDELFVDVEALMKETGEASDESSQNGRAPAMAPEPDSDSRSKRHDDLEQIIDSAR